MVGKKPDYAENKVVLKEVQHHSNENHEGDFMSAPVLLIPDALGNSFVDLNEAKDGIEVLVTLPFDSKVGDTIQLRVTQPDGSVNIVTSAVPFNWDGNSVVEVNVPAFIRGQYSVTAVVIDDNGQSSSSSASMPFTLVLEDNTPQSTNSEIPSITIPEAAGDTLLALKRQKMEY